MSADNIKSMDDSFFAEYTSGAAVLKYTRATAGYGIGYLLDHDYKDVYLGALQNLPADVKQRGIRILEFGCGGGMNLIHLVSVLTGAGIKIKEAVGTDFSPTLVRAAGKEAESYLHPRERGRIEFFVAKNESLVDDLSNATRVDRSRLLSSFDFILGVNTIRYCHRTGRETSCVQDIMDLLAPGGVCVTIDMNDRFPAFRSKLKRYFRPHDNEPNNEEECYLPSLDEYAAPFEKARFTILRKEHFCWIPHSSGKILCGVMRALTPALNLVAKSHAMRSLVVAQKPLTASR